MKKIVKEAEHGTACVIVITLASVVIFITILASLLGYYKRPGKIRKNHNAIPA